MNTDSGMLTMAPRVRTLVPLVIDVFISQVVVTEIVSCCHFWVQFVEQGMYVHVCKCAHIIIMMIYL